MSQYTTVQRAKIFFSIVITCMAFTFLFYAGQRYGRQPWTMSFQPSSLLSGTRRYADQDAWRQISVGEVLRRFEHKTSGTCVQNSEHLMCPARIRSATPNDLEVKGCLVFSSAQDLNREIHKHTTQVPLYGEREYIFPWEAELLKRPPLVDLKALPDFKKSRMVPLTRGKEVRAECVIGGTMEYRLDLVDGHGRNKELGLDDVRSWLVNGNKTATAHVTDLNNGSYHISVPCLWLGKNQLKVNVAYPWEYLRAVTNQFRLHISRPMYVLFERGAAVSHTLCGSTPNIPYSCLCNFTSWNKLSFYCGHPAHPNLTCADAVATHMTSSRKPINVTTAEGSMMAGMSRIAQASVVKQSQISIVAKEGSLSKLQPCNQSPYDLSWTSRSPQGYWTFYGKDRQWVSLICNNSKQMANMEDCLSNINIWTFGDSNALTMSNIFNRLINCTVKNQTCVAKIGHCRNDSINTNAFFYPHEHPLVIKAKIKFIQKMGSVADILDKIPSTGRHLVIVHYFVHIQVFHVSTFRSRIYALREAVSRLLKRNPNVQIAVRGPHVIYTSWKRNHAGGGDVFISRLLPLLKEIFKPLSNRVLLLDGYDMSVAMENDDVHPGWNFAPEMIRLLLNYVCGRKQ